MNLFVIIAALAGVATGFFIGMVLLRKSIEKKSAHILKDAINEAEMIRKDKILEAKEKYLQLKSEHEKQVNERNQMLSSAENRVKQKEMTLNQRLEEHQRKQKELQQMKDNLSVQIEALTKKDCSREYSENSF